MLAWNRSLRLGTEWMGILMGRLASVVELHLPDANRQPISKAPIQSLLDPRRDAATKLCLTLVLLTGFNLASSLFAFEGRITAALARGGQVQTLLYTVGTNVVRIERGETDRPYARNLVALESGDITLLFPHNRSLVQLKGTALAKPGSAAPAGLPALNLPPGIGPQSAPAASVPAPAVVGPTNLPGMPPPPPMPALPPMPAGVGPSAGAGVPGVPAMPMMPPMGLEPLELKATGEKTNLLGYACEKFELKQRGETMEIWATAKLLPFQPWLPNQPPRFGPRLLEERWPELLKAKKLFPLLATLKFDSGAERLRFEVKTIKPEKITDPDGSLFQPPPDYQEIAPLPF